MRDPLFIRVGSSRSFLELSPANRKGDKAFANNFASSFFRFAWHFLQSSLSVSSEVGIFIQKTATSHHALQIKLPGAH